METMSSGPDEHCLLTGNTSCHHLGFGNTALLTHSGHRTASHASHSIIYRLPHPRIYCSSTSFQMNYRCQETGYFFPSTSEDCTCHSVDDFEAHLVSRGRRFSPMFSEIATYPVHNGLSFRPFREAVGNLIHLRRTQYTRQSSRHPFRSSHFASAFRGRLGLSCFI